jgi:hypothetical protein
MEIHPIDAYAVQYDTYASDIYTLDTASITLTAGTITGAALVASAGTITGSSTLAIKGASHTYDGLNIGSADSSDTIGIYHDNAHAHIRWNDGYLFFQTKEAGDTATYIGVKGNNGGLGGILLYDQDNAEYMQMFSSSGQGYLRTGGSSPSGLYFDDQANGNIAIFSAAAESETKEVYIYGYRTGDASRSLRIGVGVDAADTASFDGVSNYWFDGAIEATSASTFPTGTTIGNLTLANGSITDSSGTISFNDEHLSTTGNITDGTYSNTVAQLATASINFIIDGGGSAITTGVKGHVQVPFACTITECRLLADQSGTIAVDIWKDTYANFPPDNNDSITDTGTTPNIAAATKYEDTSLTNWTTSISAGDILAFNVDSNPATNITRCTVVLKIIKDNA